MASAVASAVVSAGVCRWDASYVTAAALRLAVAAPLWPLSAASSLVALGAEGVAGKNLR